MQFEYQDFVGIEPLVSRSSDTEFIIKYRKNREGRKIGDMKFASEYRAEILTEALVSNSCDCYVVARSRTEIIRIRIQIMTLRIAGSIHCNKWSLPLQKFKHLFCEQRSSAVQFKASKKDFSEQRVPVILEVSEISVNQLDPQTRECVGR